MRIFVTGASGYLGSALCRRWAADGHEVTALVRTTSRREVLESLGVGCFVGDVSDRASMRQGMSGADWVVHAAAELDPRASADEMRRVNVEGSANVATLAYKLGVGRFLSISSMAAFGGSPADGSPSNEDSPVRMPFPSSYSATKHAGQKIIEEIAEQGLRVDTVYPGLVYGPPAKRRGANTLLYRILTRRMPAIVGGRQVSCWVYIDDVVDAIVRVMDRAEPGGRFLLTGEPATVDQLVSKVCSLAGVRPPRWRLSVNAAEVLLLMMKVYFGLSGRRPPFSRQQLASLRRHWNFDDSRAREKLDWQPRGLDEGLPPTLTDLQSG
ncbi:MAG: SDR family NAD(P)-dependent oxidoreductase [Acidobacteria bacterium]|nr:MAG: SDR family NAD(P)-dependent oxidoreductase [Acidobacteriota bacterium]